MTSEDSIKQKDAKIEALIALGQRLFNEGESIESVGIPDASAAASSRASDQFAVYLLWHDDAPLLPERSYRAMSGGQEFDLQITDLRYRVKRGDDSEYACKVLEAGEIGYCKIATDQAVSFTEGEADTVLVILDDRSKKPIGIATVHFALRRATNIVWHKTRIDKQARTKTSGQRPCVIWLTGLSASGKSTIADILEQHLHAAGRHTYLLDGDNVRHGLCRDLGFTDADRVENIRRVAEVAKLMVDAGLIVITSFISPFESEREMARQLIGADEFIEVFVDTPLSVCETRDPKGLYKKARSGSLKNFTGIDSTYEPPNAAQLVLRTVDQDAEALAGRVFAYLQDHQFIQ